jgi:NADP-dependent 3-hydroxy acid dehydrogenase YdfG
MIKDKVVIITGASSGIGEASAKLLASKGAKVVLGARRVDQLKRIAEEIKQAGGEAVYAELDVTKQSDNDALVSLAKDTYGRLDATFLNAGLMPNSMLSALKTDEWNQMIDVNIKGVLNGLAAVLPTFTAQKSGHVLATSSRPILVEQSTAAPSGSCETSWKCCAWSRRWKAPISVRRPSILPPSTPSS